MGLIRVRLEGHKKNGGYLTIMKNMSYDELKRQEIKLTDGKEIVLPNGPQTIRFDPVGLYKREDAKRKVIQARNDYRYSNDISGSKFDRYSDAVDSELNLPTKTDYTLTVEKNTLLTIVVSSDYAGNIIGDPDFIVSTMSEEETVTIEAKIKEQKEEAEKKALEEAEKRRARHEAEKQATATKRMVCLILTIIFALLTVWAKSLLWAAGAIISAYILIKSFTD